MRVCLLLCVVAGLLAHEASGVTLVRIGTPLTASQRDSLDGLGVEFVQVPWTGALVQEALDPDSLEAGILQPRFLDQDEDIAATLLGREGTVWLKQFASGPDPLSGRVLLDQDSTTGHMWPAIAPESFGVRTFHELVTLDLGGWFLIREVRFRPPPDRPDLYLESFALGVSELGFDTYRIPTFGQVARVKENTEPEVSVVLDPPVTTQALQLYIFRPTSKELGLADLEVYGGGYVGNASYESDVLGLPDIASWGEIRWSGRQDPNARVGIRTRSGADPQPEIYWKIRPEQLDSVQFLGGGGDLSPTEYWRQYDKLERHLKPTNVDNRVSPDTENWSFWSSLYSFDQSGVDIASPGPRQFFQIRADFWSTVEDGGKIDFIEFMASTPLVLGLVGEIYPVTTRIGEATQFTCYVNPTIRATDSGFDGLEITTPSPVVSVDSLRIDAVDVGFTWTRTEDGFEVLLPRRLGTTDSGAVIEVVFTAPVLREVGTAFAGRAFDTAQPLEVRQDVAPGDAVAEVDSDRMSVQTALSASLLYSPRFEPNPFTPNGDGVNDVVRISYKLLRLTATAPVSVEIHDLSGRLVKRVYSGNDPLGEYTRQWDGRDEADRLVPPGLYVCRIAADIQSQQETSLGVVCVAY